MTDPTWTAAFKAKISRARRKLTDEHIRELRALKGTVKRADAAQRLGVSETTVGRIWAAQSARYS